MISTLLTCPACATHLKLRTAPEPGKRIRCPKCRTIFAPEGPAASASASPEAVNPTVEFQATAPNTAPAPPPVSHVRPKAKPLERPVTRGGPNWLKVALMGCLLLFVAGAITFMVIRLNQGAPSTTDKDQQARKPTPRVVPIKQPAPLPKVGFAVGNLAPDIDGEDVNGRRIKLSDYRGKVVFLDFWGDWCPHCRTLYPYKRELMQKLGARSFTVIGVNCEQHTDKTQSQRVMQREKINWPTWWSPLSSGQIHRNWGISAYPRVYILDHRGVIRRVGVYSEPAGWPALTQFIDQLVNECERDRAQGVGG